MKRVTRAELRGERLGDDDGRCPQCGFKAMMALFAINFFTGEKTLVLRFCPNCGASMEGEDE